MTLNGKLTRTEKILKAVEPLVYAHRKLTMAILLIVTALLAWQAALIKRDAGFDKSIPLQHPFMQVYKQYQADFGGANTVLVALIQKAGHGDIYNEQFLTSLKRTTDEVFFLPGIDRSRVSSLFTPDVRYVEVVEGGFRGGNVIPAEYRPTTEMFELIRSNVGKGGHVGRYVTEDQTGAMIFAELLEVDPVTGDKLDYGHAAQQLEDKIRGRISSPIKWEFRLKQETQGIPAGEVVGEAFTEPGATFDWKTIDTGRRNEDGDRIIVKGEDLEVAQVDNPDYNPNVDVHILGFAKVVGDVIEATLEVVSFFVLTLFMTFILLWLYTGSLRLAWLPLAVSVTAVIWEFGLLKLFGFGLDPFAILVPFLILAVSVSHGVQYVNAWVGEIAMNNRNSFDASLYTWRRLAIYGTMAILTDVVGFATIYIIPVEIIREMSINAALGMLAIIITNKVMMPIWLTWVKIGDIKEFVAKQERRERVFEPLWRLISNVTRPGVSIVVLLISAALFGWALWKGEDLQIGDSQEGVPELRPDSRYNRDNEAVVSNFTLGTDIFKVISETDPEACIQYEVMEQIDRFGWRMENTKGVQSVLSLPVVAKQVNAAFSEGSPKWHVLPRNRYTIVQAITPVPTSSGLLNPNCSAMPVFVFMSDHKAETITRVVNQVKQFNQENGREFFEVHPGVDEAYCKKKTDARRTIGIKGERLRLKIEELKRDGLKDIEIGDHKRVVRLKEEVAEAEKEWAGYDKACPVHFAMASGNVGVMAATNELVADLEKEILFYVYLAIIFSVMLSFWREKLASVLSILLPLSLVSFAAYAVMAIYGIGMKIATLPVVALAVGIGVDYGIYVYATFADAVASGFRFRDAYFLTLRMTGKAVIFTGVTLGAGVATWLWSDLQFQKDMGFMLLFMFTANMFGAILILPSIARFLLKERELAPGETPVFRSRH